MHVVAQARLRFGAEQIDAIRKLAKGGLRFIVMTPPKLNNFHEGESLIREFRVERGDNTFQCDYVLIEQEQFMQSEVASESTAE